MVQYMHPTVRVMSNPLYYLACLTVRFLWKNSRIFNSTFLHIYYYYIAHTYLQVWLVNYHFFDVFDNPLFQKHTIDNCINLKMNEQQEPINPANILKRLTFQTIAELDLKNCQMLYGLKFTMNHQQLIQCQIPLKQIYRQIETLKLKQEAAQLYKQRQMLDEFLLHFQQQCKRREEEFAGKTYRSVQKPYKDKAGVAFSSKKLSLENCWQSSQSDQQTFGLLQPQNPHKVNKQYKQYKYE